EVGEPQSERPACHLGEGADSLLSRERQELLAVAAVVGERVRRGASLGLQMDQGAIEQLLELGDWELGTGDWGRRGGPRVPAPPPTAYPLPPASRRSPRHHLGELRVGRGIALDVAAGRLEAAQAAPAVERHQPAALRTASGHGSVPGAEVAVWIAGAAV